MQNNHNYELSVHSNVLYITIFEDGSIWLQSVLVVKEYTVDWKHLLWCVLYCISTVWSWTVSCQAARCTMVNHENRTVAIGWGNITSNSRHYNSTLYGSLHLIITRPCPFDHHPSTVLLACISTLWNVTVPSVLSIYLNHPDWGN